MHGALFIKHFKLSAGSYKTLDLLGMSILKKWVLSMRDIIGGYTVSAVTYPIYCCEKKLAEGTYPHSHLLCMHLNVPFSL